MEEESRKTGERCKGKGKEKNWGGYKGREEENNWGDKWRETRKRCNGREGEQLGRDIKEGDRRKTGGKRKRSGEKLGRDVTEDEMRKTGERCEGREEEKNWVEM